MAPAVEANSLSEVLALADNPPTKLEVEPAHQPLHQLVLYIARVPGSRDVFLTPMKPLHKVVTASDVQSCLYYVHVDSVEDDKIRKSLQVEQHQDDGHGGTGTDMQARGAKKVLRKPLQNDPDRIAEKIPGLPPGVSPHLQPSIQHSNGGMQIGRKPVGQHPGAVAAMRLDSTSEPSPHVLGPRPMQLRLRSVDSGALENRPERRNDDMRRWSENPSTPPRPSARPSWEAEKNPPYPPRRPNAGIQKGPETDGRGFPYERGGIYEAQTSNFRELSEEAGSLTLIRRYDNLQWNVGKISRISGTVNSDDVVNSKYGLPSNEIQGASIAISTPGYAKFMGREVLNGSISQSGVAKSEDWPSRDNEQVCFTRQLQVADYKKSLGQKRKSGFSDSTLGKHGFSSKFKIHKRSREATSEEMTEKNVPPTSPTHQTVDSKGYVFQSPWDGICEFHTGVAGRSLKCRHTVSPLRVTPQAQGRSAPVSELRFNLPSSKSLSGSSRTLKVSQGYSGGPKRVSILSTRSYNQRYSGAAGERAYENSASSDDRLDLSLGQEHAGGGFGGKQAKLGKLIIEIEGLKMLDLVVAANIGIWWRVYEKYV
ncbi:hypothetical protein MMC07_006101 [Pseudocyphellaria aurata]|nr:hypothetical protein [Pseudocyphellaria aurata]